MKEYFLLVLLALSVLVLVVFVTVTTVMNSLPPNKNGSDLDFKYQQQIKHEEDPMQLP